MSATDSSPPPVGRSVQLLGFYCWCGTSHPVPKRVRIVIGRAGEASRADVALDDTEVSSVHAIVERKESGFVLRDCSKNGSYVNGVHVLGTTVGFQSGDTLQLGQTTLVVLGPDGPDFGKGPHTDEAVQAAHRFYGTLQATADGIGVSFHRVRMVLADRRKTGP